VGSGGRGMGGGCSVGWLVGGGDLLWVVDVKG